MDKREEIDDAETKLKKLIESNEIVKENLDLFLQPSAFTELDLDQWRKVSRYKGKYDNLKRDLQLNKQGKNLDPNEVRKLNDRLIIPISEEEILDKIEDIRMHASKYRRLFRKSFREMRKRNDSHHFLLNNSVAKNLGIAYSEYQKKQSKGVDTKNLELQSEKTKG
jgi:hypothetical protein